MTEVVTGTFKETEIGLLPSDWGIAPLGSLFHIQQGKALSPKSRVGSSLRPFLRTANVLWGRLDLANVDQMDFSQDEEERLALRAGDLLVCEGGETGRSAIWQAELLVCYYQNHIHRLRRVTDDVDPFFFMYWMQAAILLLGLYRGQANRTTIPNLSKARLSSFVVPLPPLAEQRSIAGVLLAVRRAIEATEAVIEAAQELKKSLMQHLYTYGPARIDRCDPLSLKQTNIGPMPLSWQTGTLGTVFSFQQGKALSPKARLAVSPLPFLRTSNVLWGEINLNSLDQMDFTAEEAAKLALQIGDLLVCEGGEVGRSAIWRGEISRCCYQNHIHRLRLSSPEAEPAFFMYWMQVAFLQRGLYGGQANKTTIANLSQARLQSFEVPLPDRTTQGEVAMKLKTIDVKIRAEVRRKDSLEAVFYSLLHNLMVGKLRVALETDPNADDAG